MVRNVLRVVAALGCCIFGSASCALGGCGVDEFVYDVPEPDAGPTPDAADDVNTENDADKPDAQLGCAPSCDGTCVPARPEGFSFPILVAIGPESDLPACPASAPLAGEILHSGLSVAPTECAPCACNPSTGTCTQPKTIAARAATAMAPDNVPQIPTDPPVDWNGTCANDDPIPAGAICGPNGALCAQSVKIGALGIENESCAVADPPSTWPAPPEPTWSLAARVCQGLAKGTCDAPEHCVPDAPGFRQCVTQSGEHDCPAEGYTERFVFHQGFDDTRGCSECACGPTQGSSCSTLVSLFKDAACTALVTTVGASTTKPTYADISPPGQAISAKSALAPQYHAGTCAPSGGEPIGAATPRDPVTLCCIA